MATQTNNCHFTKKLNNDNSNSSNRSKNTFSKLQTMKNDKFSLSQRENYKCSETQESENSSMEQHNFHRQCKSKNRRNSIDSNNSNSTSTKARLKWWSDRRNHRSSAQSGSRKNSSDSQNYYSLCEGNSVRRIKKKKLKNAVWSEELWVDGPKAVQSLNSGGNLEKSSENSATNSEANEMHKKQLRIEQWIQNTFCSENNSELPSRSTDDQVIFIKKISSLIMLFSFYIII